MAKRSSFTDVARIAWCVSCLFVYVVILGTVHNARAETEIDSLKSQISDRNDRLKEIEKQIANYQTELKKVGSEKNTLQSTISKLELERKKVLADIRYTENKIDATDLELSKLSLEIKNTEEGIRMNKNAIGETLRVLNETDDTSMLELVLGHADLSEVWSVVDELQQIRNIIRSKAADLGEQKKLLTSQHDTHTQKRADLLELKTQYADQNEVLVENKAEKSKLLVATKNEEANYQKLLKSKKTEYEQVLKEMRDFESKLQFILDPSSIPPKGTVVFNWPLSSVIITQLFGGTEFAKQNSSVYGGRPYHPGVDFGAPVGTKILAPLAGTVRATGNTDAVPGCYSWGKWTLIDHANGLSTLYAHQSVISVVPGQQIATGEVIGYTGNTGYSTGPHLHFTVYAKAGVSVRKFNEIKAVTSCGAATTPVASTDAYIDPMLYLPKNS